MTLFESTDDHFDCFSDSQLIRKYRLACLPPAQRPVPEYWLHALYERHRLRIQEWLKVWARRGGLQDADMVDIEQELFLGFRKIVDAFDFERGSQGSRAFGNFLLHAVQNDFRSLSGRLRKRARRESPSSEPDLPPPCTKVICEILPERLEETPATIDVVDRLEREERWDRALATLTPQDQQLVRTRQACRSWDEAGRRLGPSHSKVHRRVRVIRRLLRKALEWGS